MKASNIGLWITGAVFAWIGWIMLDMSRPVTIPTKSATSLEEVQSSKLPVLVEFYADWCGPCRKVGPVVEALSEELTGRAKVIRVNVDEQRILAAQHGIRSIPTFIVFKNGSEVKRQTGAIPKTAMLRMLEL